MATITSTGGGNWTSITTWIGGVVPTSADQAVISGCTVVLNTNLTGANLPESITVVSGGVLIGNGVYTIADLVGSVYLTGDNATLEDLVFLGADTITVAYGGSGNIFNILGCTGSLITIDCPMADFITLDLTGTSAHTLTVSADTAHTLSLTGGTLTNQLYVNSSGVTLSWTGGTAATLTDDGTPLDWCTLINCEFDNLYLTTTTLDSTNITITTDTQITGVTWTEAGTADISGSGTFTGVTITTGTFNVRASITTVTTPCTLGQAATVWNVFDTVFLAVSGDVMKGYINLYSGTITLDNGTSFDEANIKLYGGDIQIGSLANYSKGGWSETNKLWEHPLLGRHHRYNY